MHVVALNEVSTCRSKGPKGEWIERTYVSPTEFEKRLWFQRNRMQVVAPEKSFHVQVKRCERRMD